MTKNTHTRHLQVLLVYTAHCNTATVVGIQGRSRKCISAIGSRRRHEATHAGRELAQRMAL
eukprot:760086-Rhodomonas_salina.6